MISRIVGDREDEGEKVEIMRYLQELWRRQCIAYSTKAVVLMVL